jgi:hypothetical protein
VNHLHGGRARVVIAGVSNTRDDDFDWFTVPGFRKLPDVKGRSGGCLLSVSALDPQGF